LATFLDVFDVRTCYPLLLHLFDAQLSDGQWREVSGILESYLVRRAICGLPTKNYNRVFLNLTRFLMQEGTSVEAICIYLSEKLSGESTVWPNDDRFGEAWNTAYIYQNLPFPKRIVHILLRLNETYLTNKQEDITINSPLTVEHILPRNWIEHWSLADGSRGLTPHELWDAGASQVSVADLGVILDGAEPQPSPEEKRAGDTRRRNTALQTLGNLTIVVQPLNSAISNSGWSVKKPELLKSLLPLNQQLYSVKKWDEDAITRRGRELFDRALQLWAAPGTIAVL
jgi:hypothetical protein